MKRNTITIGALLAFLSMGFVSFTTKSAIENNVKSLGNTEGEALFKAKCSSCHVSSKPEDMSKLLAPPIMGVMMHLKKGIEGKDEAEKRKNTIAFIIDYVQNPSAEKSFMEPHAIERFEVMPSQKENVTPEELDIIANYLYDNFPSKGMNHKKMKEGNKKESCGDGCGGCGGKCEH